MIMIESCLESLTIIIVHGWKTKISAKLVQQIFSLLTFIIEGVPGAAKKARPEETILVSFKTQHALLDTITSSPLAAAGLAEEESVPALGHGITVMLDGAVEGANAEIQMEAMSCIRSLYTAIRDDAALASFLPGTISSLTKILSTPNSHKTNVLRGALESTGVVLTRVLGDIRTNKIRKEEPASDEDDTKVKVLSKAWLEATVSQVRMALTPMMKLRTHDSIAVRSELERLCIKLLDECHSTLENCSSFLVETAIILDPGTGDDFTLQTNLGHLMNIYPEMESSAKVAVYNWMSSLPGNMQSADEAVKKGAIHNVLRGLALLRQLHIESPTIEDALPSMLRDTLSALVGKDTSSDSGPVLPIDLQDSTAITAASQESFAPVLMTHESQRFLSQEVMALVNFIGSGSSSRPILLDMLESARDGTGTHQVAAFWLCHEIIKAAHCTSSGTDDLLNMSEFGDAGGEVDIVANELYALSVQVLNNHSETAVVDWRLEAVALEVVSYTSQRAGPAFRPELIDVLFPVATFLGASKSSLQQHAIATLNKLAAACDYDSVSGLIVANVDYMVNSVSLRLNTLDISPASTQVLTMMIRLAGPRLIPFLDDVIDSIFAALENYHGYPTFVESLFVVLKEVVDQAARTETVLLLEAQERTPKSHVKVEDQRQGLRSLHDFLKRREERRQRDTEEMEGKSLQNHPKRPWAEDKPNEEDDNAPSQGGTDEKPPSSPTYKLLNRVAHLTQYYLTSPTPTLRRSLLELLNTASKVLAADEDSFLPLVNAVWPVVIERLRDPESFIAMEACHTLSGLCEAAGDFLSTRFKTEWRNGLADWCRRTKRNAVSTRTASINRTAKIMNIAPESNSVSLPIRTSNRSGIEAVHSMDLAPSSLGQHASPAKLWEATIELLESIVQNVRVDEEMFEEILELLEDAMHKRHSIREALEVVNKDAVWLKQYKRHDVEHLATPRLSGFAFTDMTAT